MLVLVHSKHADNRERSFLCSLLVHLVLQINIVKSELILLNAFVFLGLCWNTVDICVSLPSDNLDDMWHLVHSLLQKYSVTVCQVLPN